ncbi:hypothetical protein J4212_02085 [Candidatus Woesearchaeota archaeon]|nr:hypothetical protein [Candidatus Woesearchaeota archaeon]
MKFLRISLIIISVLLTILPSVFSIGIVTDFLENNTLVLLPGESRMHGIRIQNTEDGEVRVKIEYDPAVMSIIEYSKYADVPAKSSLPLQLNITAPLGRNPGDLVRVSYSVQQISGSGAGVPILPAISKSFNIKIQREPARFYLSDITPDIPKILAALAIAYLIVRLSLKKGAKKGKIIKKADRRR